MFKEMTIRSVRDDKWFNLDLLCGYLSNTNVMTSTRLEKNSVVLPLSMSFCQ